MFQITWWQRDTAGIAVHRFADETGQLAFLLGDFRQVVFDAAYIIRRTVWATELTAIGVWRGHRVHPVRAAAQGLGVVSDRGRHRIRAHRPAVIGLQHTEHVATAAVGPRQANRQVVGLAAAVDQEHAVHAVRGQLQQTFGELGHGCVVEARVGVEQRPLAAGDCRHAWMAVAQYRYVVEHVEVGAALHVDQMVAPAAFDARWINVIVFLCAGEAGIAPGQQGHSVELGFGITGQPQQRRR
ncbi:hypothetical protein D9M71_417560 [compost metagenome]